MTEIPDFDADPRPVFAQIADHLRGRIESLEFAPGTRLPSQTRLADEYGVAVNTLREALKELRQEGVIGTQSTRGTVVLKLPEPPAPSVSEVADELRAIREELGQITARLNALESDREPSTGRSD